MHLILHYLKRYKIYVFFNLLAILGFATAELGIPTIVSRMIDNGIILNDRAYIYKMGAAILAVAVAGGIGNVLLAYCSSLVSSRVTRDIRNDIFRKAQEFSHTEYNKFGISSMITRTTNDAFILMQFINIILRTALLTPIMIIISMFMVIRTSMTLSMVIGGCVPIICLGVYLIARTSNPISTRQQKGLDKLNRITRENLTGVRVIRAFCKDEYETERFDQANEDYAANAKKLFKLMSVTQPSFFLLLNLAVSIVFVLSSRLIDMGSLQVGNLVAFQEYMFHAMFSMMMFSLVFVMYPRAEISARRIKELLDEEPLIQNPRNPVTAGDGSGTLVFDHVSFQYPDGEAPVLRDITFEARADLSAHVPVDDLTLCIVIGNLLENAFEACRRISGARFIRVQARWMDDHLMMMVENSYNGQITQRRRCCSQEASMKISAMVSTMQSRPRWSTLPRWPRPMISSRKSPNSLKK